MQVYDGLPILTAQPSRPTRLVAVWPLSHEASVAEYAELAHAAIDEVLAAGRTPVVAGGTGLYLRAARDRPPAAARAGEPVCANGGRSSTTRTAQSTRTAACRRSTRRPRPASTQTTGAASCARSSSRRPAPSLAPEQDRLWTEETRHPTARVRPRRSSRRARQGESRSAPHAMFEAGVEDEVTPRARRRGCVGDRALRPRARRDFARCRETRRSRE